MRIALGADHGGFDLKEIIKNYLQKEHSTEHEVFDCGPEKYDKDDDYPFYAGLVVGGIDDNKYDRGILICTRGFGMAIAGNKGRKTRAANCWDAESVRIAREHNNINILVMGSDYITSDDLAKEIVNAFLYTESSDEARHVRRVKKLSNMI